MLPAELQEQYEKRYEVYVNTRQKLYSLNCEQIIKQAECKLNNKLFK